MYILGAVFGLVTKHHLVLFLVFLLWQWAVLNYAEKETHVMLRALYSASFICETKATG